ncbi:MAG: glycoside hydrolase family 65 protein [Acidobacteriota bacterium]|nr:glycoside hydrolase family 65 protein [Acidobacteriota bacterium]
MRFSRRFFLKASTAMAGMTLFPYAAFGQTALAQDAPSQPAAGNALGIPQMSAHDFSKRFDPAYLSNGLIGIRPGPNPLAQSPTAVSGFVYSNIPYQMQAISPAPYPLVTDLEVNRVSLLERPDLLKVRRQSLDMATGELLTQMSFDPGNGASFLLEVLQFASRSVPALLCQELRVTSSTNVQVRITAQIGVKGVPGAIYLDHAPPRTEIDLVMGFRSYGDLSKLGVAVMAPPQTGLQRTGPAIATDEGPIRRYDLAARAGQTSRFQTIAAMVSEFYHPEPELESIRLASWGATLGFEFLRRENRERWQELWKSRVKITGDADSQKILDASFFYLHSSLNPSDKTGMPPFGLSQTRAYYGHSFWDTESWSLLPVMMTSPDTAKSLLEFRRRSLGYAKKLAALFGYRGAQFPWEAAPDGGFGVTPTFAATGWEEQHITADVALAFWEYQLAAGDDDFLKQATWPVLKAVGNWIASRGIYTPRGFEIHHIMGPDEGLPNVNNDAYVNLISKMVLEAAIRCATKAGETPSPAWGRAARKMFLPVDHARNIMLPCDHPPQGKNYPIGGLDMLTVHDPPIGQDLFRNTFNYEETFRSRRRPSIGFATAAAAATAAFLGYRRQAAALFRTAWQDDWMEPFGMLKEAPSETYGCFLTNCGSLLQTAMLGFTGLRIREGDWRAYPASLPEGWSRIEIDRVWVRGSAKRLVAENGGLVKWSE